jgi:Flp pilus assembly protein TadD
LLEQAVALDPRNVRALNNLGVTYMNLGRLPEARLALIRAIEASDGVHFRAWYNLGVVEQAMGHRDAACRAFQQATTIHPSYHKAHTSWQMHCIDGPEE